MQNTQSAQDAPRMTTREAAAALGVSTSTIRRHAAKLGGRKPFGRHQLDPAKVADAAGGAR
jgi:DeoR/GlpR family transcriptional regulator of sugar metabolism